MAKKELNKENIHREEAEKVKKLNEDKERINNALAGLEGKKYDPEYLIGPTLGIPCSYIVTPTGVTTSPPDERTIEGTSLIVKTEGV